MMARLRWPSTPPLLPAASMIRSISSGVTIPIAQAVAALTFAVNVFCDIFGNVTGSRAARPVDGFKVNTGRGGSLPPKFKEFGYPEFFLGFLTGADGGANCAYIVAQMGDACGGYACENAVGHGDARCVKKRGQILTQAA